LEGSQDSCGRVQYSYHGPLLHPYYDAANGRFIGPVDRRDGRIPLKPRLEQDSHGLSRPIRWCRPLPTLAYLAG